MDIVGDMAVGLVGAGEVVEVASLAEESRLIGVTPVDGGLAGEVDEAGGGAELECRLARV